MNLPLHNSNVFFELWTEFFPLDGYESDIENIDPSGITQLNIPSRITQNLNIPPRITQNFNIPPRITQNFNIPSGITQSINTVFTNWSNRYRYIPLFNDDVIMLFSL